MVMAQIEEHIGAVMDVVINAALGGDLTACKILADRACPIRKGSPVSLSVAPSTLDAAGCAEVMANVIRDMAGGRITPEEANVIANVVETRRKTLETEELEARLAAVEQRILKSKS